MLNIIKASKTFNPGTVNAKKAIDNLSLHVKEKDFISIIGSNGAGKSTLFNLITGTFLPDSGYLELAGKDITWAKEHHRSQNIGRLFQDPMKGTAPRMTIEENMALAYLRSDENGSKAGAFSRISKENRSFFKEKLASLGLGLETRAKSAVGLLSGGQRQALTLLMATLVPPKLLLLDEHTAALDPATAEKVLALTKKIVSENGITCIMITHNIETALSLGNRTIMMDDGGIALDIAGEERSKMTVPTLLNAFKQNAKKTLDNDRILLQN